MSCMLRLALCSTHRAVRLLHTFANEDLFRS
jgi:hypothetical protein